MLTHYPDLDHAIEALTNLRACFIQQGSTADVGLVEAELNGWLSVRNEEPFDDARYSHQEHRYRYREARYIALCLSGQQGERESQP